MEQCTTTARLSSLSRERWWRERKLSTATARLPSLEAHGCTVVHHRSTIRPYAEYAPHGYHRRCDQMASAVHHQAIVHAPPRAKASIESEGRPDMNMSATDLDQTADLDTICGTSAGWHLAMQQVSQALREELHIHVHDMYIHDMHMDMDMALSGVYVYLLARPLVPRLLELGDTPATLLTQQRADLCVYGVCVWCVCCVSAVLQVP